MASEVTGNYRRLVVRFITGGVLEGRLDAFDELCDPVSSTMPRPAGPRGHRWSQAVIGFSCAAIPDHPWTDKVQVLRDDRRLELQVPTYYIPLDDIDATLLSPSGKTRHSPSRGDATLFTVKVPGREAADAAARYRDSPITELRDLVRFDWEAMDAWYEEDEPVYVHPRDPHTRVDILASSRHVRVELAGVTVPTRRGRGCSSRPGCRPGTTCRAPTYGWTCWNTARQ